MHNHVGRLQTCGGSRACSFVFVAQVFYGNTHELSIEALFSTLPTITLGTVRSYQRSPLAAKGAWLGRLVVKDFLNLLHDLRSQLLRQLHGLDIVVNLVSLCGAKNDLRTI